MQECSGRWISPQGFDIFHRTWCGPTPDSARGVVVLVHGLSEHSGRYAAVAEALVAHGWAVHAFDHVGHGRSSGERQCIHRFGDLGLTLSAFRSWVQAQHPDLPLVMLGHSMGGLLVAHDAADFPQACTAVVLSAPAIQISAYISPWKIRVGRLLSVLLPGVRMLDMDPSWISRDPEVVARYLQDPLVYHGKTTARSALELLQAMHDLTPKLSNISAPLLVIQGTQDHLVNPGCVELLMTQVGSRDKQAQIHEGLYHECFNEPERAQVLAQMCAWLAQFTRRPESVA